MSIILEYEWMSGQWTGFHNIFSSESFVISLQEVNSELTYVTTADNGQVRIIESSLVDISGLVEFFPVEHEYLNFIESTAVTAQSISSDSGSITIVEQSSIAYSGLFLKSSSDILTILDTEVGIDQIFRSSTENFSLSISETSSIEISGLVTISTSDSLTVLSSSVASYIVSIISNDSLFTYVDEASVVLGFGFVAIYSSDSIMLSNIDAGNLITYNFISKKVRFDSSGKVGTITGESNSVLVSSKTSSDDGVAPTTYANHGARTDSFKNIGVVIQ